MALTSPLPIAVAAVAVVLAGAAVWLVVGELPEFWDPCQEWGIDSPHTTTISPGDECQSRSTTSETKVQAALRMAAMDGFTFTASVLAIVGAWRRAWVPLAVAGLLMLVVTAILFLGISIAFPLALGAAILDLVAARRWRKPAPEGATVSDGL